MTRTSVEQRAFDDGHGAGLSWAYCKPGDSQAEPPYPPGNRLRRHWYDGYVAGWQMGRAAIAEAGAGRDALPDPTAAHYARARELLEDRDVAAIARALAARDAARSQAIEQCARIVYPHKVPGLDCRWLGDAMTCWELREEILGLLDEVALSPAAPERGG